MNLTEAHTLLRSDWLATEESLFPEHHLLEILKLKFGNIKAIGNSVSVRSIFDLFYIHLTYIERVIPDTLIMEWSTSNYNYAGID